MIHISLMMLSSCCKVIARPTCLCGLLLSAALLSQSGRAQEPELPKAAAIQALIRQLDSDQYETRKRAELELIEAGSKALPLLDAAAQQGSTETRLRATNVAQLIGLRAKLSPQTRATFPGIEDELVRDREAWARFFLLITEDDAGNFPRAEMELLGTGALQRLSFLNASTVQAVSRRVGLMKLRSLAPALLMGLKDLRTEVCRAVIEALGELGCQEAIPELTVKLEKDEQLRAISAWALGKIGARAASAQLVGCLKDQRAAVRASAAHALGRVGAATAIHALSELLKDEDEHVRASVASALGRLGAAEAVPALLGRLKDQSGTVRASVAVALGELRAKTAVNDIVALLKDEDDAVRGSAASALGALGASEALAELMAKLDDADQGVRGWAAEALGQLGAAEAIPALITRLKSDSKPFVRAYAAKALGMLKARKAVPELIVKLKDNEPMVCTFVIEALCLLDNRDSVPDLIVALNAQNKEVRATAADALAQLGAVEAVAALEKLRAQDGSPVVRLFATGALANLGQPADRSKLAELLHQRHWRYRMLACRLLARLQQKEATSAVAELLNDDNPYVRAAARAAVEQLKGQ